MIDCVLLCYAGTINPYPKGFTVADRPNDALNICCPYCSGELYIETRTEGSGYLTYDVPDSLECTGEAWCSAVWEKNGELRTKPNYLLYPDLWNSTEVSS